MSLDTNKINEEALIALKFTLSKWVILISPMIPHLAEELWKKLGYGPSLVSSQSWPKADLSYISNTNVNIVIQVNGKKKLVLTIPKGLGIDETKKLLIEKEAIKSIIADKK